MKHLSTLAVVGICLGSAMWMSAQRSAAAPVLKPFKGKLPKVTPTPFIKGRPVPVGPRIGERFHLRVWAVVLSGMPTRNWSGTLKVDEQLRWVIPSSQAANYRRGPGETLEISEDAVNLQGGSFTFGAFYGSSRKVKLRFDLFSVEEGQSSRRAAYVDALYLLRESGKTYKCSAGKGEVALYAKVESLGYIYGLSIERPLPTPTPTPHFGHPHPRHPEGK
jgi:hypothetical protein